MDDKTDKVTQLLTQTGDDQRERLAKDLLPVVYDELRDLAQKYLRGERRAEEPYAATDGAGP